MYRGLSVYLKVLCGTIGSPPANVPAVTFKANGTTRQSYDAHGSSACAMGCHNLFDPPGFAFENYDGIGAYRTMEAGQPVDSTGTLVTPGNATITFQNALDLFKQLAKSTEAQSLHRPAVDPLHDGAAPRPRTKPARCRSRTRKRRRRRDSRCAT